MKKIITAVLFLQFFGTSCGMYNAAETDPRNMMSKIENNMSSLSHSFTITSAEKIKLDAKKHAKTIKNYNDEVFGLEKVRLEEIINTLNMAIDAAKIQEKFSSCKERDEKKIKGLQTEARTVLNRLTCNLSEYCGYFSAIRLLFIDKMNKISNTGQ